MNMYCYCKECDYNVDGTCYAEPLEISLEGECMNMCVINIEEDDDNES